MKFQFRRWGTTAFPTATGGLQIAYVRFNLYVDIGTVLVQLVMFFCLLPRLQDVEDREKENQAGFLSKRGPANTLTKDLKLR